MIKNELNYPTNDAVHVIECISQKNVSHDCQKVSYAEIIEKENLKIIEHSMKQHVKCQDLTDEKVMCIACGLEHSKSDRLEKTYGVIETNHCPHCNCESFWKL